MLLLKDAVRTFLAALMSELWNALHQNPGRGVLSDIFARVGGPDTDRKIGALLEIKLSMQIRFRDV